MSSLVEVINDVTEAPNQALNDLGHHLTEKVYSCSGVGLKCMAVTTPTQIATAGANTGFPRA